MTTNEEPQGRLSLYVPKITMKRLKLLGVERDKPVNTLAAEALAFWWAHQSDVSGPLFPVEGATTTEATTPKKQAK